MNDNFWGVKNNTSLPELSASSLVRNLKERYHRAYHFQGQQGEDEGGSGIYTWTGTVLLAVNPYQKLNVYGDSQIEHHFQKTITQADPHPFGIASHAFQTLNKTKSAQSIVVSGESGAGKTETAKFVMRFLSTIGRSTSGDSLSEFLESTNPILEAFGNAKTCRNENSSRFGKVMKLFYSQSGPAQHKLVSAAVETYLLARSRVTHTPQNERNYHVFYLLTNGKAGDKHHLPELFKLVRPASHFNYLANSASIHSEYLSDETFLKDMLKAFSSLGVSSTDQVKLFELVLALLWMGNIAIEAEDAKDANGKCKVSDSSAEALEIVASVLGIKTGSENDPSLEKLLTEQKLSIGTNNRSNSSIWAGTNAVKARTVRDAVVRRIYTKIFDYIVSLLNVKLASKVGCGSGIDENRFISILDIFGFENLPTNGLEQLCINYANERLQNFFLKNVVISEAEEYSRECVLYPGVSPPDNGPVIKAVAGRNGIFDTLRKSTVDSMLRPLEGRDYDSDFYTQLGTCSSASSSIVKAHMLGGKGKNNPLIAAFTVCHYAEDVPYLVEGFVEANKDSDTRVDFILSHFKNQLLQDCLATPVPGGDLLRTSTDLSIGSMQQRRCIATTFSSQVDHLLEDHLEKTRLHCIRCIKPNDAKIANSFDDARVSNQLRVSGMFEVLTLMAHSYPIRIPYTDLFNRYKPLLSDKILLELSRQCSSASGSKVSGAVARLFVQEVLGLLAHGDGDKGVISANSDLEEGTDFQFGTSKVFFKLGKVEPLERILALCDKDKHFAQQVADLIGKRIMAKRKSRQLKFMRTSFKLLVIYRRRQNYWNWFHAYFTRLTFLVKSCKQHFIPQIKLRRIRRKQAARSIQQAYRAHLERRRVAGQSLIQGLFSSFVARAKLCSQSKLRMDMTLSSELIQNSMQTYGAQCELVKIRAIHAEKLREAQVERLRLEAENQAKLAAEREIQLAKERAEMEQRRIEAERIAEQERQLAAQQLEITRIENERLLGESRVKISALESEIQSKLSEMDSMRVSMTGEVESVRSELKRTEMEGANRISELESQVTGKIEEIAKLRSEFDSKIEQMTYQHNQEIETIQTISSDAIASLQSEVDRLRVVVESKSNEIESIQSVHAAKLEEMTCEYSSETDRLKIQFREIEDGLRAQLAAAAVALAERSEMFDYSRSQAQEEIANVERLHSEELDSVRSDAQGKERELNEKITQLMDQLDTNSKLLERTKANDQEIIDRLMAQHESDVATTQEELEKTRYELESKLETVMQQLSDQKQLFDEKQAEDSAELEQLKASHSVDLTFTQVKAKEMEEALSRRIEDLLSQIDTSSRHLSEASDKHTQELYEVRSAHESELHALRSEMETLKDALESKLAQSSFSMAEREAYFEKKIGDIQTEHEERLAARESEIRSQYEESMSQLRTTQEMLNAEASALLREKEEALIVERNRVSELQNGLESTQNGFQGASNELSMAQEQISVLERAKKELEQSASARQAEADEIIASLRNDLKRQRAEFADSIAARESELTAALATEKERLERLLSESRGETAAITSQLESVVQEKAKLAVMASQSLMQGEKVKKDAEDHLKRERAEMERKLHSETSRIKRDLEIINKRTLEVKMHEVEELRQETLKKLEEAEKMRSDAVKMMQEIHRAAEIDGGKTIAVLPQDKEEIVQQAIRDYHSASDDYERAYVIERRRDANKKEKMVDSAKTSALEAKLQRTSVAAKVGEVQPRKSLGNVTNVLSPRGGQPAAKIPRLSGADLITRNSPAVGQ